MADGAELGMEGPQTASWLGRLHADRDNIRSAINFAVADGNAECALILCANAWRYWLWRGNLTEGRQLVMSALASGDVPPALRLRALKGAGALAGEQGDLATAKRLFEEGLALARMLGDDRSLALVEANLGSWALLGLDYAAAITSYERSARFLRSIDAPRSLSLVLQNLGQAYAGIGRHERAVSVLTESLGLVRR